MEKAKAVLLLIAGVILLLPVTGVTGASRLAALYELRFDEPNLLILMRHRAILFGLIGGFICYSAWRTEWQALALSTGLVNTLSFIWLAWATGGYNASLQRVVVADVIALCCLLAAAAIHFFKR